MAAESLRSALAPIAAYLPPFTAVQEAALADHLELLLRWNRKINLTAVREFVPAARKHAGESLFLAARIAEGPFSICDVGSGGGYPGIPVAILRPQSEVTLIESDVRKSVFLREAARELANVRVVTARFEDMEGRFDWLVSRAVNLGAIRRGPESRRAAVLGGAGLGENTGVAGRYRWSSEPIPWEKASYLWLGDVSRETFSARGARKSGRMPGTGRCFT